jgi:hypothetical protein
MPGRTVLSRREGAVTFLMHPRETMDGGKLDNNQQNEC